ncbi:MAG: protein jag [Ruminococcus sp.]|nr:protein jag [Ruminococcus sp.]
MNREAIATGNTVEEAREKACEMLGVETYDDNVDFEIIEMQQKKILGLFGGHPAKVRVFIKTTPAQAAADYLQAIIKAMGLNDIEMNVEEKEKNIINIDITGEDVGSVIGRRGETLDALQYLTCLVANHVDNSYCRVTINTGDYREKREKTLEILGRKLAIKAAKTGRKSSLEPMNPYERRIIHTAVQKINGAISWSEGENINRHVVIGPDPKSKGNYKGRSGGNRRPYRGGKSSQKPASSPNPDRKPLNEGGEYGLYGRIDK